MNIKIWYLLPIFQCLWYYVGFIITYLMSVYIGHLPPVLPYVSETGALQPESCIFSIILVFGGLQMTMIMYIKHRQTQEIMKNNSHLQNLAKLDLISCYVGAVGTTCVGITGCIQVTASLKVHLFFAGMAFMCGIIYDAVQTFLSFKMYPIIGSRIVNLLRAFILIAVIISSGNTLVFGLLSWSFFTGDDILYWMPYHGGYGFHLVSSISEWIIVLGSVTFLTTYCNDFKNIAVEEPHIDLKNTA